jgi:signal transduction histidine kinase/CheY-like chemotaxis protein
MSNVRLTNSPFPTVKPYALAFAAVAFSTCIAVAFRPISYGTPFLVFLPAVFYALWNGGFRVALFASFLSALSIDYFLIPPPYSFYLKPQDRIKEAIFLVIVGVTAWLFQRERDRAEQSLRLQQQSLHRAEVELQRANRALKALGRIKQILVAPLDGDKLLQQAVEIMVQEGKYPLAWIGIPENNPERRIRVAASAGDTTGYLTTLRLTWNDEPNGRGPTGKALREGKPFIRHILADTDCGPFREFVLSQGFRSSISIPLIVQKQTIASLTLYAEEDDVFVGHELDLVSELAADLALGLTSIRLREQAEENRESRLILEEQYLQSQKMEAIGRLAGGISHDFNNLLMVIMAQTDLLSLQLTGPDLARAQSIMQSVHKAAELTRQLLAFSRKQFVQPNVLSVNHVLMDITRMARHLLSEDIEMTTSLCHEPWLVKVDRSQFEQVIMNLLVNAGDAMPNGGKLTLETANEEITTEYAAAHPLVPPGRYVMLAVSDTGIGMDKETQIRIFEPFFTTKEPGKGTGLGLSVVYGIVKQSGGFIWLYSEPGKGTSFRIYLPAAESSSSTSESSVTPATAPLDHAAILLVEDDPALREVISEFLLSAGHKVVAAESHEQALERAAESGSKIDLLLTDVVLKGSDGKQLANCLCSKGFRFKTIFMSGYTPNAIAHRGVSEGSAAFLQKPFSRATLLAKIQEALSH